MTTTRLARFACAAACLIVLDPAAAGPPGGVQAWAPGPLEVAVSLPKPADAATVAALVGRSIPYYPEGEGTPGPDVEPFGALKIAGASARDGGRTLVLATDPHPIPARYVLPLDGLEGLGKVVYGLDGVEAAWSEGDGPAAEPAWKARLSDLDLRLDGRAGDFAKPGRLRLDALVRLPVPSGKVEAVVESPAPVVEAFFGDGEPEGGIEEAPGGGSRMKFAISDASQPAFLSLAVATGPDARPGPIRIALTADGAAVAKPVRFLLPWVPAPPAAAPAEPLETPDLSGGDPARGEAAFFSKEALCSQCHAVAGKGGRVGPDLTTTARKGVDQLYRSIALPGEAIAPDFVSYTVSLKDGRVASGIVRAEGPDAIVVVDAEAKPTTVRRDEIEEFRPATTSLMPPGLVPVLGEARLRDIVAYLKKAAGG